MIVTIPRTSRRSFLATTNQAPNRPKIAPLAPSAKHVGGAEQEERHPAAERAQQVDRDEADPAEQLLKAGSHRDERPHVEQDVEEAQAAESGRRRQERGRDQPVPLAGRDALKPPAEVGRRVAEHAPVVGQARLGQLDEEQHYVEADQGPGHRGGGHRAAAEGGPRLAGALARVAHALHALLPDRGRRGGSPGRRGDRTGRRRPRSPGPGACSRWAGTSCPAGLAWSGAVIRGYRCPLAALDGD